MLSFITNKWFWILGVIVVYFFFIKNSATTTQSATPSSISNDVLTAVNNISSLSFSRAYTDFTNGTLANKISALQQSGLNAAQITANLISSYKG
ncbi:MAG: hypothetical protein ABR936_11965 [Bacteroidota bacterium]|jgi:hypothetical protein